MTALIHSRADPRPSFHSSVPGLQTAWDSTSLGSLKMCPRRYQYEIIEGYRLRAESVHLTFGIHYHDALEFFDRCKAEGMAHKDALHSTVRRVLDKTLRRLENGSVRPWDSGDTGKNRETLLRSVVWYIEHFRDDPAKTIQLADGRPAVELSFRFETGLMLQNEPLLLSGHLDRLVEFGGDIWVLDHKTTKSALGDQYFASFSPDNQMTLYTIASQVVFRQEAKGVIVDACQVGVTFSRFQRGFTLRHQTELEEWTRELQFYLRQAERFALEQYWPKNDKACGMYGGCPFRAICSEAPHMRQKWLRSLYHRAPWDPLEVRGDV